MTFSLLFGTTWSVNALVFFAILLSVLVAIGISAASASAGRAAVRRPLRHAGPGLAVATRAAAPRSRRASLHPGRRLAFAPIVFANLVFAHSFRDTAAADMAFASNLLGAMVGGALEDIALISGYRSLLFIVAGLYLLAYLFASRWRVMADRGLEARLTNEPPRRCCR